MVACHAHQEKARVLAVQNLMRWRVTRRYLHNWYSALAKRAIGMTRASQVGTVVLVFHQLVVANDMTASAAYQMERLIEEAALEDDVLRARRVKDEHIRWVDAVAWVWTRPYGRVVDHMFPCHYRVKGRTVELLKDFEKAKDLLASKVNELEAMRSDKVRYACETDHANRPHGHTHCWFLVFLYSWRRNKGSEHLKN